ncbi:hypothetical protein AMATHDRAFT_121884, partial [Amanita thiersii Skay4041]
IATSIIKILLFVPWCITVGGTILMWPNQLEWIAFQTGYIDSPEGIHRFAHWAEIGHHYVMIFLAFLACLLWTLPPLARVTLVIGLLSRFAHVWHEFQVDWSLPLGLHDKQSIYLLATSGGCGLSERLSIQKTEAGFVV